MKAILLAAGFGTRLRPLTNTIPKCLVPINGRPLLDIWLDNLTKSGIEQFLVNTHYLPEKVEKYINQSKFKGKVKIVNETVLLGTAGTLIFNTDFFQEEDGLLIHADNYCTEDFGKFIEAHKNRPKGSLITMLTFRTDNPSSCGIVELDNKGIAVKFHEKVKNPPGNLANGAVYILSKECIKIINTNFKYATDFSIDILGNFIGQIYTFETKETFLDIGTLEAYEKVKGVSEIY